MATISEAFRVALQYHQSGNLRLAEEIYRKIIDKDPGHVDAVHLLGVAALQAGRADEAVRTIQAAIALDGARAGFHNNLGEAFRVLDRLAEARACYEQALRLDPNYVDARNNLGIALKGLGQTNEALVCYQEALRRRPNDAGIHSNLGNTYRELEQLPEALGCYEQALRLEPGFVEAHWNRALAWLLMGNFEQGWPEYEWRWRRPATPPRPFPQPRWDGSPLRGKTILLHAEQGLGDTLQFIRYAPLVTGRGGMVIAECQPVLVRLLSRCAGIQCLIARGQPLPAFDVHAPLLSLPGIFGTTVATVPANVPYIFPDAELVRHWQQEVAAVRKKVNVGIAWQGGLRYPGRLYRSPLLAHFAPLARREGVRLVSLQKGPGSEQLAGVAGQWPVVDWSSRLDETAGAFMDSAALMKSLDLVVTSDTAVAHLAGALGVPVWVSLPVGADWRWLLHREDSPWYPTMRLFRQPAAGDWPALFARLAGEVAIGSA